MRPAATNFPGGHAQRADVAQSVEQLPCKQQVVGSIPTVSFLTGLAYVAMSFGINYAFAGRSFKLWLIDGGYHTLQFTLYGLVLGLWH